MSEIQGENSQSAENMKAVMWEKQPIGEGLPLELENRFTYHPPKGDQPEKYEFMRGQAKVLALWINTLCPESREKSLAFTKLEEAVMWANAAIARRS